MSAPRGLALASLPAFAVLTFTMGCLPQGDFRCHDHAACGAGASCEIDGRCSAPDVRCPSGRRYLAHEGDASNTCVGDSCAGDPLVEVAAGAEHACARRQDGRVSCWGRNDDGQLGDGTRAPRALDVVVKDLSGAASVAAGQRHTCAATVKGEVYCWGADDTGQLGDGGGPSRAQPLAVAGITNALAVSAGEAFSCAVLSDGTVRCWGDNTLGQLGDGGDAKPGRLPTTVFALAGVRALSGKWQHVCALRDDETLWCWGDNSAGQLGDGSDVRRPRPVQVQTLGSVTHVATGLLHTCATTRAEGLYCWGDNGAGQLGNEGVDGQLLPAVVRLVSNPIAVTAGASHTCSIRVGGETLCWGANADGQLGEGSTSALPIPAPVAALGASVDVVAGGTFTCALDAHGALFCWGDDHYGELGLGRAVVRARPVPVSAVSEAVDVASGDGHTCAVVGPAAGPRTVACWGANQAGQLGDATLVDRASAEPVKGAIDALGVAVGLAHSCAVADGGALWCWGRGSGGQLGPAHMIDTRSPAPIALDGLAVRVAAGDMHTCVALADGSARCWGKNGDGQLGDGTTTDHSAPAAVLAATGAPPMNLGALDDVVAGAGHTCAHLADETLRCWGRDADGQLGDGATKARPLPVALTLGTAAASAVSAGAAHTCALDAGGGVWCWGANGAGQLGDGDTADAHAPVAAMNVAGARGVAAGGAHTCAIAPDQTVLCWGANDEGQLGQLGDDGPSSALPVPVADLTKVVQLGAGAAHTCARRDDGTVWCWGANTSGQLGDGDVLSQVQPQLARLSCP